MKEIGILFTTPMVQAIGDNRKTLTRRTRGLKEINEAPDDWVFDRVFNNDVFVFIKKDGSEKRIKSPYGRPGDLLWVRETWIYCGIWDGEGNDPETYKILRQPIPEMMKPKYWYKADNPYFEWEDGGPIKWKPSIHMPKAAARYWLKVKSVRPERIQSITEEDAIAEGVKKMIFITGEHVGWQNYSKRIKEPFLNKPSAMESFQSLIVSINGPAIWDQNQWVWRIEFERTQKP